MLYYDRIDVPKGIDINKISASEECDICHYWYFLNNGFKFQPYACNRCHDLQMMTMNLSDIAIFKTKNVNNRCIIPGITKSEVINLMQNINLTEIKRNFIKVKLQ